ncbi:MAG: DnaJ domain-containing protein, partial [Thermodesulfobacteriota bacterium]
MQGMAETQLFEACTILFGDHLDINRQFLEYLQLAGVRKAYRQRALETHPDVITGRAGTLAPVDTSAFRQVQQAYEDLSRYLKAREQGFVFHGPPPHAAPRRRPHSASEWRQAAGRSSRPGQPGPG